MASAIPTASISGTAIWYSIHLCLGAPRVESDVMAFGLTSQARNGNDRNVAVGLGEAGNRVSRRLPSRSWCCPLRCPVLLPSGMWHVDFRLIIRRSFRSAFVASNSQIANSGNTSQNANSLGPTKYIEVVALIWPHGTVIIPLVAIVSDSLTYFRLTPQSPELRTYILLFRQSALSK